MEWLSWFLFFVVGLLGLTLLRVPFAFALLALNIAAAVWLFGTVPGLRQVLLAMRGTAASFVLSPIPLFILMGELLFRSGLAGQALDVLNQLFRRVPGRLAMLTTAAGALFGVLSGSTVANTALLGQTLLPEMTARRYRPRLAMGSILASGGLAMILPPSGLAIVWGAVAGVPIGPLLIAGLVPGVLMALGYAGVILGWSVVFKAAPAYGDAATQPVSVVALTRSVARRVGPLVALIVVVLGLIFAGVATVTESAALGVLGAVLLLALERRLRWPLVREAAESSTVTSVTVLFLIACAGGYSQVMSASGASRGMIQWVTAAGLGPMATLTAMFLVVLVLGMVMEPNSIILVTAPLFMPIAHSMGWDPLWFSILVLISLQIGMTTPPFGLVLFVMKSVVKDEHSLMDVYLSGLPFVIADLVTLTLLTAVPILILWLPGLMG